MFFGYDSIGELITQTFKHITNEWVIKYVIPFFILVNTVFNFLFDNYTESIYFLMIVYIIDFCTGIAKAINYSILYSNLKESNPIEADKIKDKVLTSRKFPRFLFTMLAAILILSLLRFAGVYSIIFNPLFAIFYSIFLGGNIISIGENLTELKLLPLSILNKLKKKITDYTNEKM
ncbi:phage holin family protein [Echinicola shivajiensis]|uniref:phage holin family protein n=1 Tax=Echinicola shivajiensis TaxID=1035916 RepID=UPI001BFCCB00|nr:phage holin family protein [Echinicola shivajiensis]